MPGGADRARADARRAGNLDRIVTNIVNLDRVNKGYGAAGQLLTDVSLGLDDDARVGMAHPFAAEREGATRVDGRGRTWFGNCAWDGLGIVAALGLDDATVTSTGIAVRVRDGVPLDDAVFHVLVPARHWWEDVWFT